MVLFKKMLVKIGVKYIKGVKLWFAKKKKIFDTIIASGGGCYIETDIRSHAKPYMDANYKRGLFKVN